MAYIELGKGWKDIRLGVHFDKIKEKLDPKKSASQYLGSLMIFHADGLELGLDEHGYITMIRFYSFDPDSVFAEESPYKIFGFGDEYYGAPQLDALDLNCKFLDFKTAEGVSYKSTVTDVLQIYGNPRKYLTEKDKIRVKHYCYSGFDFVFYDERLASIGVFSKEPAMYKDVPDEISQSIEFWEKKYQ